MAPKKKGLDYFDVDCVFDDKVELVVAEFGMRGLGVLVRLWQKIYGEKGYYCIWNDDVALMFSRQKTGLGVSAVSEIIGACLRRGLFDCGMFESCSILTSESIQKRYFNAVARRENVEVKEEYLLIDVRKNGVTVCKNADNVCKNADNVCNNPQSRVDKSRVEKSNKSIKADVAPEIEKQWAAYVKMRKDIKKPLTQRAAELALSQLNKLSDDVETQGKILDRSTFNCWQGLFPLNDERSKASDGDDYTKFKPSRS